VIIRTVEQYLNHYYQSSSIRLKLTVIDHHRAANYISNPLLISDYA